MQPAYWLLGEKENFHLRKSPCRERKKSPKLLEISSVCSRMVWEELCSPSTMLSTTPDKVPEVNRPPDQKTSASDAATTREVAFFK